LKLLENIDYKIYEAFNQSHPKGHFMQSIGWSKLKSDWISEIIAIGDDNGNITGAMKLLIRKLPGLGYSLMYSPRGPVCDLHNPEILSLLFEGAKKAAKKYKAYTLRLDTDSENDDTEYLSIMKKLGFRSQNNSKNFEGIQPRFVFRLDIKGKNEEEMLQFFHQKTRYNIRLAEKKGVTVSIGGLDDVERFHEIMLETGIRDNFVIRPAAYFKKMLQCMGPKNSRLYLAHYDGKIVAGTLAVLYGNKCWYLYGASSNSYRNVMPNYLLQWEMIKWALAEGCEVYDFRGVSGDMNESNPLYGLYKFKKGFNGKLTEFVGELDYVYNPAIYLIAEKGIKIFRDVRGKLFELKHKRNETT
jgi:peptidoglycan pentaglycine glycine transferase (the first glycine)